MLEYVRNAPHLFFSGCFDISHWNGLIKWSQVPDSYKLVFIKATEGARGIDSMFKQNLEGAQDHGLMTVPYHFIKDEDAAAQLSNLARVTKLQRGAPIMLDWEAPEAKQMPGVNLVSQIIDGVHSATGRLPLMYHGIYVVTSPKINACPWHIPKYGPEPKQNRWLFWQDTEHDTSEHIGECDHDFFNGTLTELTDWYTTGALPERLMR